MGQAGADEHENAPAKAGYQTKHYWGVTVSLPPGRGGSHSPRAQAHCGEKTAADKADAKPRTVAKLCVFLIACEWMSLGIFGREVFERLGVGDCVAMAGGLGAGKTVLVRGIAEGLRLDDTRLVSSPTYVLVREYPGRTPIFHIDLYRMGAPRAELADLGLEEMLEEGVALIEWADRATTALPHNRWEITIEITAESSRKFTVSRIE